MNTSENAGHQDWVARMREEEGKPAYVPRHEFGPQPVVDRRAITRAYARAAEFCRQVPELAPDVKVRLMRQALSQAESRVKNRYLMRKRAWVRDGMPHPRPWEMRERE